jgi:hypothetical protein
VPASGQLNGAAINLILSIDHGRHVFGAGTIGQDPQTRQWFVGRPLVGPGRGDAGDWPSSVQSGGNVMISVIK